MGRLWKEEQVYGRKNGELMANKDEKWDLTITPKDRLLAVD